MHEIMITFYTVEILAMVYMYNCTLCVFRDFSVNASKVKGTTNIYLWRCLKIFQSTHFTRTYYTNIIGPFYYWCTGRAHQSYEPSLNGNNLHFLRKKVDTNTLIYQMSTIMSIMSLWKKFKCPYNFNRYFYYWLSV